MGDSLDKHSKKLFIPAKRSLLRSIRIRSNQFLYKNRAYQNHLSMDGFARLANYHVYGGTGEESLNRRKQEAAKILFVNSDCFNRLDFNDFPNLNVVISGNSDYNFEAIPKLPAGIRLLLLQNCSVSGEKIKTLPIGLENKRTGRYSNLKNFSPRNIYDTFKPRILVPPMSNTNPVRSTTITKCLEIPEFYDVYSAYLYEKEYFALVRKYQFLLCLEGNGFENHRIWEALYLGIFPILLRTKWSAQLEYLNLPILLINDVTEITREYLFEFWLKNVSFHPDRTPQLWLNFWKNLVNSHIDNS